MLDVTIERLGAIPDIEAVPVANYHWAIEVVRGGVEEIRRALGAAEADFARLVLRLKLEGTIDLATWAVVNEELGDLRARVFYLEEDDAGLLLEPTDDDLDGIDTRGFVRVAMDRLREKLAGPDVKTARRALALLHGLYHQTGE